MTYDTLPALRRFFDRFDFGISGYSPTCKLMWENYYHAEYAVVCGCLVYKNTIFGKVKFNYPVPIDESADENAALAWIESYCVEKYIPLVFIDVPEEKLASLGARYRFMELSSDRNFEDYRYDAEAFRAFQGKKYAGQRNHIHKFFSLYPNAVYKTFTSADKLRIKRFFKEFLESDASEWKIKETKLAEKAVLSLPLEEYLTGGYEVDGKIVSFTFGMRMGNTLYVHIEKALKEYEGVYTATANAFAKANGDADYINREDDSGAVGLRTSKTQYQPQKTVRKFHVCVGNEWQKISCFPLLTTERLTLGAISKEDAKAYYDICVDEERNKYWGYDYKKDLKGELYPDYFYDVQKRDARSKMCFSFAVRLNGKMIGEGVLYRFTGTGEAEAGLRIATKYAGFGYGKEAFKALTDWALYGLGLDKVVSKCYHENEASKKMLSSCMRQTGEDEKFLYFERKV